MGYEAILSTGEVIAPAVDFLDKQITAAQANRLYRGVTGTCSHCLALRRSQQGTDNLAIQTALSQDDLPVHYVSAVLTGERVDRIMHFAHKAGYWQDANVCRICSDSRLVYHGAAVQVIARWARKQWPGASVQAELRISAKGAPPTSFRPDIAIHDANGKPIACIEYQRSGENFHAFLERDRIRLAEFQQVLWFFDRTIYNRSAQHRNYLHDSGRQFFKTWTDPQTLQLNYDEGAPHKAKAPAAPRYKDLDPCSEASLIRGLERHDNVIRKGPPVPDTSLDMKRVDKRADPPYWCDYCREHRPGCPCDYCVEDRKLGMTACLAPGICEGNRPQAFSRAVIKAASKPSSAIERIKESRRIGKQPAISDRIAAAIDAGNWTPQDIQRWDHSQGWGMLLRIKQIEQEIRKGKARR